MADTGPKTRLRRTRTGCFKCRSRRRKCDEGKPKCRRCVEGEFECQYGTRLSFLDKNAMTVAEPVESSKPSYSTLRFVEPESTADRPGLRLQEVDSPSDKPDETSSLTATNPIIPEETIAQQSVVPDDHLLSPSVDDFASPLTQVPPQDCHHQELYTPASYAVDTSPGDAAYETALDVLLTLGNDQHVVPPETGHVADGDKYLATPPEALDQSTAEQAEIGDNWLAELFPNCAHLPQDRVVQLMRHYRYNIAPWLDIGDKGQTFGLIVSRIAMESVPVLESLLAISLTSLDRHANPNLRDQRILPTDPNQLGMSVLNSLIVFAFVTLRRYVVAAPTSWQSPFRSISFASLNSALFQEQSPATSLAVSWLILRLGKLPLTQLQSRHLLDPDVSVGLMTSSSVSIPDILLRGAASPLDGSLRESLNHEREPLLLCARVLNHCFGHDSAASPSVQNGLGTNQNWKLLFECWNGWYTHRPRILKPMLEIEESDQLFPLVLFTNGAAVLANQLYHTSMLLLLQNRPRTLPNEHGRAVFVSPLWHAQRICGISLNNDNRTSWDFSLIASFYLAGKRMTYEPQQKTILQGIDRIGAITGWNLNALAVQLMQEWQPD
ncbi:hypothetical protein G7046_g5450 [Stylonectria norvegica]|nr:hypothetical protein G7046_g5450 [Stylonectria norvegica]